MWTFVCAKCSVKSVWASDFAPTPPKGKLRPRRQHCGQCVADATHEAGSEVCTSCLKSVPPKVLVAGPLADVFGDWVAVAPRRRGAGLFGPQRSAYRAVLRRIFALAPRGWRPHAFRRGARSL